MKNIRGSKAILAATGVLALAVFTLQFGVAQDEVKAPILPTVSISQMQGTWVATLSGVTGCGTTTLQATFTLDATGKGTQTSATEHTAGCGDIIQTGQSAQIQSLGANGKGFIALGCGSGCGFGFNIQVNRDHNSFNMGAQAVPGNYLAGIAVRR
jgi:hypothetical protein